MEKEVPFEIAYEKAKAETIDAIANIAQKYSMPTWMLNIMVNSIALEARVDSYESMISVLDVSMPEDLKKDPTTPDKVINMDEKKAQQNLTPKK